MLFTFRRSPTLLAPSLVSAIAAGLAGCANAPPVLTELLEAGAVAADVLVRQS
jgi:hypothetical protein